MDTLASFFKDGLKQMVQGSRVYWIWVLVLSVLIVFGIANYIDQFENGLIITGMSDQVSWGAYIANFTYLVGVAAAAVMLVIPAYVFHRKDIKHVVLIGEGLAVAAVVMCMTFVTVDLGHPERIWHMAPIIGHFHWPASMLAWDVLVLSGYLFLNLTIPFYILYTRYKGREPNPRIYLPGVFIAIVWAIGIHTVTAFLFSSNVGRPFWHYALLAPKFLAGAFASGPALIILALWVIKRRTPLHVDESVVNTLAIIVAVSLQIDLFFVFAEAFTEFYFPTAHTVSSTYMFFGIGKALAVAPWTWAGLVMSVVAAVILTIHPLRQKMWLLNIACFLTVVGIWVDKGIDLIIPGFVPTPVGEVFQYTPSAREVIISVGVWAVGALVFTLLAKVAIPIETGALRAPDKEPLT